MKTVKRTMTILLLGLIIFSCKKEKIIIPVPPEPPKEYSIIGEWIWMRSCGGFDGYCYTFENTGDILSITFNQNDSVIIVANSDTVLKTDYIIKKAESFIYMQFMDILHINCDSSSFSMQGGYFIVAPEFFDHFVIYSLTDTLRLDEDLYDGNAHLFTRKLK